MSQFTRFFSGKLQNLGNCAGVKYLTNIMSVWRMRRYKDMMIPVEGWDL